MNHKSQSVTPALTRTSSACVSQNMGERSVLPNWRRVMSLELVSTIGRHGLVRACNTLCCPKGKENMSGGKGAQLFEGPSYATA
jgi:hypothetical protein